MRTVNLWSPAATCTVQRNSRWFVSMQTTSSSRQKSKTTNELRRASGTFARRVNGTTTGAVGEMRERVLAWMEATDWAEAADAAEATLAALAADCADRTEATLAAD